jgi:hypothetical protein
MKEGGGSRTAHDPNASGVHVEDTGSSSDHSLSTASSTTLKDAKTINAERKKEGNKRKKRHKDHKKRSKRKEEGRAAKA